MGWLEEANVETREQRVEKALQSSMKFERSATLKTAKQAAGINKLTVAQAEAFIDNKLDNANTAAEKVEAIRTILKKMVPYLLDED